MSGENQYKAEGHGLQDARKGVLFDSFPPVLQLQLKRFEYDFQRDTMVKVCVGLNDSLHNCQLLLVYWIALVDALFHAFSPTRA